MKTAAELRAELARAEAREYETDRSQRKAQSDAWSAIVANPDAWEWRVDPETRIELSGDRLSGVRVNCRVKPEILAGWRRGGPSTFAHNSQDPGTWQGCFYYRTHEDILTHCGGGSLILRDPMLCNDAEWAAILAGNIPQKYRKPF